MTLPSSGPLSMSQIAAEFGVALPCVFPRDFYGKPSVPSSGALSMAQFHGLSNVIFTPEGGFIQDAQYYNATATLYCNLPATWNYTVSGQGGTSSLPSGSTSTSIQFTATALGTPQKPTVSRTATWEVTAVCEGVTRSFTVQLTGLSEFG